jgi:biotin carboxyl carrier protein
MKKLLITVNGKRYEVDVEVVQDDEAAEGRPPFRPPVRTMDSYITPPTAVVPNPVPTATKSKASGTDKKTLTSPINGVILEIPVKEGAAVKQNDILFVLEAMKMKTNISSPQTGKIKSIKARVGDKIEAGQVLLTFE